MHGGQPKPSMSCFKKRNEIGSRVSVFQGGTVVVEELDPSVQKSIDRHRYGKFRIGVA